MKTQLKVWVNRGGKVETFSKDKEEGVNTEIDISSAGINILVTEEKSLEEKDIPREVAVFYIDNEDEEHKIYLSKDDLLNMLNGLYVDRAAHILKSLLGVNFSEARNFLVEYRKGN